MSASAAHASPGDYFGLHFVDEQTGRGIPLVELELTNHMKIYSDSGGYVAFDEPGLMDQRVFFWVRSYGYEAHDVGFGNPGVIEQTTPGKIVEVKLKRTQIAQRLYRMTGIGIYRDTVLLGKTAPIKNPLIDGKVMGQDTVETVLYKGKMLWCWGDTDRPDFPLGNFNTSGATSKLPNQLNVERGIDFTYFTNDDGFCRGMIKVGKSGSLPVWIDGMMNVPDTNGQQKCIAHFVATKNLVNVEKGLLLFDDADQTFKELKKIPLDYPVDCGGHPMRANLNGVEYYYFPVPYATVRVQADFAHAGDPSQYEGYTCLKPGTTFSKRDSKLNRDASGKLIWTWQRGAKPVGPKEATELENAGQIKHEESPYQMRDADNGHSLYVANGSIAWNPWAQKWLMTFGELGGQSNLGEIYVAFANSPEGPWTDARKVATHAAKNNNNDFYNPMMHPEFMQQDGQIIYFEGTLVITFSGNTYPTPRYNYNNILYKVDLADPRLKLPEPPPGWSNAKVSSIGP